MIPGGRMNPRQMKHMMKRMGIESEEIEGVEEVLIRTATKEYVFTRAQVTMMTVQGQKTAQIVGEPLIRDRMGAKTPPPKRESGSARAGAKRRTVGGKKPAQSVGEPLIRDRMGAKTPPPKLVISE